jgi:hypothetical protein
MVAWTAAEDFRVFVGRRRKKYPAVARACLLARKLANRNTTAVMTKPPRDLTT